MKHPYRWDNLNREELRKLAEENALVLIPLGATEQHGPHLPTGTDSMLAEADVYKRQSWSSAISQGPQDILYLRPRRQRKQPISLAIRCW